MNIQFKIDEKYPTHSGKPSIIWQCNHCKHVYDHLTSWLYQAKLQSSPRQHLQKACEEFTKRINANDTNLFAKSRTGEKLKNYLCQCGKNVVDLEYYRRVQKANHLIDIFLKA